jgi:hypothetical protein
LLQNFLLEVVGVHALSDAFVLALLRNLEEDIEELTRGLIL